VLILKNEIKNEIKIKEEEEQKKGKEKGEDQYGLTMQRNVITLQRLQCNTMLQSSFITYKITGRKVQ